MPDFNAICFSYIDIRSFSRLMNPDWSVQVSGALAVCKVQDILGIEIHAVKFRSFSLQLHDVYPIDPANEGFGQP